MTKPKIIYFRESLLQSVLADTYSMAVLVLVYWINYHFIGNSHWLSAVLLVLFFIFLVGKGSGKKRVYYDKQKLISDLQDDERTD
jgi:hypothetical protein